MTADGEQVIRLRGKNYEALAIKKSTPVGNYLFLPYGPALTGKTPKAAQSALRQALDDLRAKAAEEKCFFVRIEPIFPFSGEAMTELGLVETKEIEPKHTWVLPLSDISDDELLAGMEKNKPRSWRNMAKKEMSVRNTQNPAEIGVLTRLLAEVGEQDHFTPQSELHLKNQLKSGFATLYIVELGPEKTPIAASLVYDFDGTRYYAHAAADYEHRKLRAGTILLVQMILDAKHAGARQFDFWGITISDDPHHPWQGFTAYKKSFGGQQVDYAGTWDLPLIPAKYRLYQGLRKANLRLRKLKK